ncbi:hypothetical protein L484_003947 [Morus notabilis]|uniref:Vacuolar iron transporter n=1 Tax=Morus notabilis TaxID=981085 RepID=W9R7Q3_9ROSA|nr:hypothetical protein L484_003947 [Morus notabilis]
MNSALLGKACCLLSKFGFPTCFLVRSPSTAFGLKTSFEVRLGCSVDFVLRFGCSICAHVNDGKLERMTKTFLGFEFGVNGYWLWFVEPKSPSLVNHRVDDFAILFEDKELVVADKNPGVLDTLVLGFANLVTDGISMGFGDFVSSSTERYATAIERAVTEWDVTYHNVPLLSFIILIPFTEDESVKFFGACLLSALALAFLVIVKARIAGQNYAFSVVMTLFNGAMAAAAAYSLGWTLKNVGGL